jgi:hypothetical protein
VFKGLALAKGSLAVGVGVLLASAAFAEPPERATSPASVPETAPKVLAALLEPVGATGAVLKKVERTVERQTRVMYDLARSDVEHAKQMYCPPGDAVIDRYDPKVGEAENLSKMKAELEAQLPRAREIGCLNHVENESVFSVDVPVGAIAEDRRATFVEAAQKAVREGKVERFLQPPTHPDAYHFEFKRD